MCAAISDNGIHTHICLVGPYVTQHLLTFLDTLYKDLIPEEKSGQENVPVSINQVAGC